MIDTIYAVLNPNAENAGYMKFAYILL